jgi:biopolymer transport protein ExbB
MSFNLLHIWASMGMLSKLIAGSLLLMAVASIAVVVERMIAFERSARDSKRFVKNSTAALNSWDPEEVLATALSYDKSILARQFGAAVQAFLRGTSDPEGGLSPVERARRELERARDAAAVDLRRGMSVVATVGSIAPFVGLLGTVVGIITAFQSIAVQGSGGLGAVSAGISEALVETALGLMVAIPAVLAFNYLSARVTRLEQALARSTSELLDEMENEHGRNSETLVARRAA